LIAGTPSFTEQQAAQATLAPTRHSRSVVTPFLQINVCAVLNLSNKTLQRLIAGTPSFTEQQAAQATFWLKEIEHPTRQRKEVSRFGDVDEDDAEDDNSDIEAAEFTEMGGETFTLTERRQLAESIVRLAGALRDSDFKHLRSELRRK
jgi:hypothetical protein